MKPCALFNTQCYCDMMSFFSGDCKNAREAHEKKEAKFTKEVYDQLYKDLAKETITEEDLKRGMEDIF